MAVARMPFLKKQPISSNFSEGPRACLIQQNRVTVARGLVRPPQLLQELGDAALEASWRLAMLPEPADLLGQRATALIYIFTRMSAPLDSYALRSAPANATPCAAWINLGLSSLSCH